MTSSLRDWLASIELDHLTDVLEENQVGLRDLPLLSESDLKELGLALGPRRRIQDAIAKLNLINHQSDLPAADKHRSSLLSVEAERRQLSVMFADLVGSTELSRQLDPEDLRGIMRSYQDAVAGVVTRYAGHVAKYLGDGVLAYFGWPHAHEDQAERAVRAGLEVIEAVEAVENDKVEMLRARVGIATGQVVVGDLVGECGRDAEAVTGETPNLAARLQGLAEPGQVVIGEATKRLIGQAFSLVDLGESELKGFEDFVRAWLVVAEQNLQDRFKAAHSASLSRIVGRDSELQLLLDRWALARRGEGQVVLISGEAGIGKSRLIQGLIARMEADSWGPIFYHGSPFHENSALYPVAVQLQRALGFKASDDAESNLNKLDRFLDRLNLPSNEVASLLAGVLSLPLQRYPAIKASPDLHKQKTFAALASIIEALARQGAVLMVVEDAHWIDRSTTELLHHLIGRIGSLPVLLIISHRPDFDAPWSDRADVTILGLNRLGRAECTAMVAEMAGTKSLPDDVVEQIIKRTDGIPLFVEELTKALLDSGLEGDKGGLARGWLRPATIPASLHDLLIARLDRLGPAKEIANLAAMLGRTFSQDLLAAVSGYSETELAGALSQLIDAGLIYRRGATPEVTYEFKHALVQDAAYHALLKSSRQRLHARIVEVLEDRFPATVEAEPEILAHHYTEAGLAEQAVAYWQEAGQRAMKRSANVEAEGHLRRGLEVLARLPESPERYSQEVVLQNTLGVCLMPTRGFDSPEVAEAFSRAASLAETQGNTHGLFVALRGIGQNQMVSGDLRRAQEQTIRILGLANELNDRGTLIEAHHLGWITMTFAGDYEAARTHAEAGWALYDRERDHQLTHIYSGHDPGVCSRSFGALPLWQLGFPGQALAACQNGEVLAQELDHPFTVAVAFWATSLLNLLRRETSSTVASAESAIAQCSKMGFPQFVILGQFYRTWAVAAAGSPAGASAELRKGIDELRVIGTEFGLPSLLALLAEVCGREGAVQDGLAAIEEGLVLADQNGDHFSLPELQRVKGELLLAGSAGRQAEAVDCFKRAMRIAASQKGKLLELRSAASLARLLGENKRRSEARNLLAPVYGWFTEGFDTPDLRQAKALLDELA